MKRMIAVGMALIGMALGGAAGYAQEQKKEEKPATLKSVLLEQLRSTHNKKEWFVDAMTAVNGLTPEQASWKDGKGNHSAGQLTYHLVFWNRRSLANADENQVKVWASEIAHIGTHNAYHIGQIVYIRRLQGSWDAEKGVK